MGSEAREQFSKFIPDGDLKDYTDNLRENLKNNFTETMQLLRDKEFQDLLDNYKRPKKVFLRGYDIEDTVEDEVLFKVGQDYQKPEGYLEAFEKFVKDNPEHIEAIEILLTKPASWNINYLDNLREKLKKSDFGEKDLQRAHKYVFKKPLADIISMIKHAADFQLPILNATERVEKAIENITKGKQFSDEQQQWLVFIKEHLIENLAISEKDFDDMPVFVRRGGLVKAKKVFGDTIREFVEEINSALAA